jgi:hypothetical protein
MTKSQTRKSKAQGMNWIRPAKRLAIYMRDGLACAYCGGTIEDGCVLTLDHITPLSRRGSNNERNLVTACLRCNSSRGNRGLEAFCRAAAAYLNHGVRPAKIINFVRTTSRRRLDLAAAKALIARRGGFVAACRTAAGLKAGPAGREG